MCSSDLPQNPITISLTTQLVKAATSVGANYCEADNACSKKNFINKIAICKKESRETRHWLRMMGKAVENLKGEANEYMREARELHLIFSAIINTCKKINTNPALVIRH